jgi:hypothetical protein
MEHLWSQAGATSGNQSQMAPLRKRLKQADRQPVATHGNRFAAHGKEEGRRFESVRGLCVFASSERCRVIRVGNGVLTERPCGVHGVDVGLRICEQVKQPDRVVAAASGEMAVVAVDHSEARSHVARKLER